MAIEQVIRSLRSNESKRLIRIFFRIAGELIRFSNTTRRKLIKFCESRRYICGNSHSRKRQISFNGVVNYQKSLLNETTRLYLHKKLLLFPLQIGGRKVGNKLLRNGLHTFHVLSKLYLLLLKSMAIHFEWSWIFEGDIWSISFCLNGRNNELVLNVQKSFYSKNISVVYSNINTTQITL